jgi:DNA polymerase delta subunit 2
MLKPTVEKVAAQAWDRFQIAGEEVKRVNRVLDVRQGELCWVSGTVYMELIKKPNILDDITKDVRNPPPITRSY